MEVITIDSIAFQNWLNSSTGLKATWSAQQSCIVI